MNLNEDAYSQLSNIYKLQKYQFNFYIPNFFPSHTNQKMPDQYLWTISIDIFLQLVNLWVLQYFSKGFANFSGSSHQHLLY